MEEVFAVGREIEERRSDEEETDKVTWCSGKGMWTIVVEWGPTTT